MRLFTKPLAILLAAASLCVGLNNAHASTNEVEQRIFIYEEPTMKKFSQLYWAISRLNLDNTVHLDNFMMINECEIYNDYFNHEFEWLQVRESTKSYIEANKKKFPLRFQFTQPLRLGEYDIGKKEFEVFEEYQIQNTRRFEVRASDSRLKICGKREVIEGYPRGLMVELSRPFEFSSFALEPEIANRFISEKLERFKALNKNQQSRRGNVFMTRDAYLVMKVKVFASKGEVRTQEGEFIAHVLGVLEGIEIYSDQNKYNMIYEENFRKNRTRSPLEMQYIAEYEAEKAAHKKKATSQESLNQLKTE